MISRTHFFLLGLLLAVALVMNIFLTVEMVQIKHLSDGLVAKNELLTEKLQRFTQRFNGLQRDVDVFDQDLKDLSTYVTEVSTELPNHLREEFRKTFMSLPTLVTNSPTFTASPEESGVVKVVGNRLQLEDWLKDNEFFLDQVARRSLVLEWNAARNAVVVADVIAGSVFDQLGLKKGDAVLSIDGKTLTRGDEIRSSLIEVKAKKIVLQRGAGKVVLDVIFSEVPEAQHLAGDLPN